LAESSVRGRRFEAALGFAELEVGCGFRGSWKIGSRAHHDDGKRFIVRAEILTAFLELERAIHQFGEFDDVKLSALLNRSCTGASGMVLRSVIELPPIHYG